MGMDVPITDGKHGQNREYWYDRVVAKFPELAEHPDVVYGDNELFYRRMVNEGIIEEVNDFDSVGFESKLNEKIDTVEANEKFALKGEIPDNVVTATEVRNIQLVDFLPESDPAFSGTLYIAPKRAGFGTDFTVGLSEITPRWNISGQVWEHEPSQIVRQGSNPNGNLRTAFELNRAGLAENVEATIVGSFETTNGIGLGVLLRGRGTYADSGGLAVRISADTTFLKIAINGFDDAGGSTSVGELTTAFPYQIDTQYIIRARADGDMIYGKAWPLSEEEPEAWQLALQTSVTGTGFIGGYFTATNTFKIDAMGVSYGAEKATTLR